MNRIVTVKEERCPLICNYLKDNTATRPYAELIYSAAEKLISYLKLNSEFIGHINPNNSKDDVFKEFSRIADDWLAVNYIDFDDEKSFENYNVLSDAAVNDVLLRDVFNNLWKSEFNP